MIENEQSSSDESRLFSAINAAGTSALIEMAEVCRM
ncbi:MAG: hypothetical protein ACI83P_000800 [Janthinobacterium sp.]|jgi:hypothetical protein